MKSVSNKTYVYWECIENGHNKFWGAQIFEEEDKNIGVKRYVLIRTWGKIGTKGQRVEMLFSDRYEAERELDKLIWDKERKGYKGKW